MKDIKYTDESIGLLKVIPDFLPGPEQLAFREESTKITIGLSRRSIAFFKDAVWHSVSDHDQAAS